MQPLEKRLYWLGAMGFSLLFSLHVLPQWKPGEGMQTDFTAFSSPGSLEEFRRAVTDRKPYHLSKVGNNYSHDLLIVTPFARAADFVKRKEAEGKSVTAEELQKAAQPERFTVVMTSRFIDAEKSRGALLVLKVGDKVVQPFRDEIISEFYKAVGFYAVPRYEVSRAFDFDLTKVQGGPSLMAVIQETNGKELEISVDIGSLR